MSPDDVVVTDRRAGWLSGGVATVTDHAGTEIRSVSTDAVQLALFDVNAHSTVLMLCGPSGLEQVVLADGTRTTLDDSACSGLLVLGGSALVQTARLTNWYWAVGEFQIAEQIDGAPGADLLGYAINPSNPQQPRLLVARSGSSEVSVCIGQDPPVTVDTSSPWSVPGCRRTPRRA